MLSEYSRYLESIRDSLVQCGVAFPSIEPISSLEYSRVFNLGEELCSLMYFYDIMVCSGNMDGIFLPSDRSYLNHIRVEAFKEFSEDILPLLKEQLGDTSENLISELFLEDTEPEEPEEWVNEDVSPEDMIFDAEELFGDEDESVIVSEFELTGGSMWDIEESNQPDNETLPEDILGYGESSQLDNETSPEDIVEYKEGSGVSIFGEVYEEPESVEYVSKGTELFELSQSNNESRASIGNGSVKEEPLEYVSHGTELFGIQVQESSHESEYIWCSHGTELFSLEVGSSKTEETLWEEPDEESQEVIDWEDDDESEDQYLSEELVWEEPDVDDSENSISWEEDESQSLWEEDEEPFKPSHNIWGDPMEEVGSSGKVSSSPSNVSNENKEHALNGISKVSVAKEERDIVDTVQDAASSALTSAKKFITRLAKSYE